MLIGNLGKDVELIFFDGGGCIGKTSMATTKTWKNKNTGEKESRTEWHNLVFRGKGAETVEKFCGKGSKLFVEGEIRYRSWEKDGEKKYITEIEVYGFEFLSPSKSGYDDPNQAERTHPHAETKPEPQPSRSSQNRPEPEDDLPF